MQAGDEKAIPNTSFFKEKASIQNNTMMKGVPSAEIS
jgi:hypothetical protein